MPTWHIVSILNSINVPPCNYSTLNIINELISSNSTGIDLTINTDQHFVALNLVLTKQKMLLSLLFSITVIWSSQFIDTS